MPYTRIVEDLVLTETLTLKGSEWDNTLIRNVTIENVNGNGIMLRNVDNVLIENVTIRNVSGDGIKLSTLGSTSDVKIRNSTIEKIGEDGINAGQRKADGVDHPGLQIIGNSIDMTGMNGGATGLLHGIYVQSTDFLIQGNRVLNALDGNGISVRSSGQVLDNYVETTRESGIAYFPDHANGPSDRLVIKGNVIVDTGNGTSRTDINLLNVPSGRESEVVGNFVIEDNILTQDDRAAIRVDSDYGRLGSDVRMDGNEVTSEAAARSHETPNPDDSSEQDSDSSGMEFGLALDAAGSGRTRVTVSEDEAVVETITVAPDTHLTTATLEAVGLTLTAGGAPGAKIGVDAGRLFVASNRDGSAGGISGAETLVVELDGTSGAEIGYGTIGLIGAGPDETVLVELLRSGTSQGTYAYQGAESIDFGAGRVFDEIRVSGRADADFAIDALDFSKAGEPAPVVTHAMGLDLDALWRGRTKVSLDVDGETAEELILGHSSFFSDARLDALSLSLSVDGPGAGGLVVDTGRLGVASGGEGTRSARQISEAEELIFTFEKAEALGDALSMDISLQGVSADEIVLLEAFRDGKSLGTTDYLGMSDLRLEIDSPFDEVRLTAGEDSAFSIAAFEVTRIGLHEDALL